MADQGFSYVYDPNLPESYEEQLDRQFRIFMRIVQEEEKVNIGRLQVQKGELRAEFVETFLSAFPAEVSKDLEDRIAKIKEIESEKKFKAELIRLLVDVYMIGLFHGAAQPEAISEIRKRRFPKS